MPNFDAYRKDEFKDPTVRTNTKIPQKHSFSYLVGAGKAKILIKFLNHLINTN